MGALVTIVTTVAAAAGAVALYRFIDNKTRAVREVLSDAQKRARAQSGGRVIDYERDPSTGIFKPKS